MAKKSILKEGEGGTLNAISVRGKELIEKEKKPLDADKIKNGRQERVISEVEKTKE